MINIAIADDMPEYVQHIESILKDYARIHRYEFDIKSYPNGAFLIQDTRENKGYDLYLLDVEMPENGGFDIAKVVREMYYESFIIFITGHREYAVDGYQWAAFRYILKDEVETKLPIALDLLIPELERRKSRCYVIERQNELIVVRHSDIIKIEKDDSKYSLIYTRKDKPYRVRSSVSNILKELNSDAFIYVNKGVLVNISHVNGIENRVMELNNGYKAEISRSRICEVKRAVSEYYRGKMDTRENVYGCV